MSSYIITRTCKQCPTIFTTGRMTTVFCSQKCQQASYRARGFGSRPMGELPLTTGTKGALGELRTCADLLSKGWEVFRAVSPSCSCDLIMHKDGKLLKVEVRTGCKNLKSGVYYPGKGKIRADILAIVLSDGVVYAAVDAVSLPPELVS